MNRFGSVAFRSAKEHHFGERKATLHDNRRDVELDVATLSQWNSSQTDNIRDFGGGGATFNLGGQNQIWKRGTLRKFSDDPMYLLRRFGG